MILDLIIKKKIIYLTLNQVNYEGNIYIIKYSNKNNNILHFIIVSPLEQR